MFKPLTISFALFASGCVFIPKVIHAQTQIPDSAMFQTDCLNKVTKEEMESILEDANPLMLKKLAEDAELRKQQAKSIRKLLAVACQAVKEGFAANDETKQELVNIGIEITAVNYEREKNQGKDSTEIFGSVSDTKVKDFYEDAANQTNFDNFLKLKIQEARENGQIEKDLIPTEDQIKQAKDYFAKTRINYKEAQSRIAELPKRFRDKLKISIKLQQAQYISRLYSQKMLSGKVKADDAEIEKYIAARPELNRDAKRVKANEILQNAKRGANFAKLARDFSDDPGSKNKGGLYENIKAGMFVPEFEQAALSLEPGQIYPKIVETNYGYHIIKLLRKSESKAADGETRASYDVRNVLISTGVEESKYSMNVTTPLKDYVKAKIEDEKQRQIFDKILLNNPIEVAEDYDLTKIEQHQTPGKESSLNAPKLETRQPPKKEPLDVQPPHALSVTRVVVKGAEEANLPVKIKNYLDLKYRGWKLSPSDKSCGIESNIGIVKGDFNGDAELDYAVKFTQRKKGFIIAFLARNRDYKSFVLNNDDAAGVKILSLATWEKGEIFRNKRKRLRLQHDAPAEYRCESETGRIYYFRNGKFIAY